MATLRTKPLKIKTGKFPIIEKLGKFYIYGEVLHTRARNTEINCKISLDKKTATKNSHGDYFYEIDLSKAKKHLIKEIEVEEVIKVKKRVLDE